MNLAEIHSLRYGEAKCVRCAAMPTPGQLTLFDVPDDAYTDPGEIVDKSSLLIVRSESSWPRVETSSCGRPGFWRQRTPAVFGRRTGVGPLIAAPDTNILISLRMELEGVEQGAGLVFGPLWGDREGPVDALRDLVQLWWWRDVRFRVSSTYLSDALRPLSPPRALAREAAVQELEQDFFDRGGYEACLPEGSAVEDVPCAFHSMPVNLATVGGRITGTTEPQLPDGLDQQLVLEAFEAGCHIFLTADKQILRCHSSFFRQGMAILNPTQLLEALDDSDELDDCASPENLLAPDLSVLSRFYGAFGGDWGE
jgi:hypothetical protein